MKLAWRPARAAAWLTLALAAMVCVAGCGDVAEYTRPNREPDATQPDADRDAGEQPQPPAPEPSGDEAPPRETLASASLPEPDAETPPLNSPSSEAAAASEPEPPLADLDELFGPAQPAGPEESPQPQNDSSPPAVVEQGESETAREEGGGDQTGSDPFQDDPLPAEPAAEQQPPPLWRTGDPDATEDGFDELFSAVAPEQAPDEAPPSEELTTPDTEPPPAVSPQPATPTATAPASADELPPLPEWSPERPDPAATSQPTPEPTPPPAETPPAEAPSEPADDLGWLAPTADQPRAEQGAPEPDDPSPRPLNVDAANTRRLAWLLGARFSLSVVAGSANGSAPDDWAPAALAEMLGVDPPERPEATGDEQAITHLIKSARTLGKQVAAQHGRDHAALLEIALKTNALAAVFDQRPELAAPVARAVEEAAPRTGLDPALWRDLLAVLKNDPTSDRVEQAVFELHASVERALRGAP